MKIAIVGSRNLVVDISEYVPDNITLLISGGARGIDFLAEAHADAYGIPKLIIKPDYDNYGKVAPFVRNKLIVDMADKVIAVWNGESHGTKFTIDYAVKTGKPVEVHNLTQQLFEPDKK